MIESIKDKNTLKVWRGEECKKLPANIQDSAREKLAILNAMTRIEDLWGIPSLKAEKLSKDRTGQWSIRINAKWRICFNWNQESQSVTNAEITDYH